MRTFTISSLPEWYALSAKLRDRGYILWQSQYMWDMPEGYHAWFWLDDKEQIEAITHSEEVHRAIIEYKV